MQARILTLTLAASRSAAFNFLADIENLPGWTGGFCEWIELHREGWWAYTAVGELAVATKVDDISGEIDLCFHHVSGWTVVLPLRVRSDGEGGSLVTVACRQVPGLADDQYEQLFDGLMNGLRSLTQRMQPQAAVAA